jgi:hypothetical protein
MAIPYYLTKLGLDDSIRDELVINIFIRKDETRGSCASAIMRKDPREFDIVLNPYEEIPILQTLAHELVHLVQFATGRLKMFKTFNKWNGEKWKGARDEMDDYYDSPWEIEAFGREEGLFLRFLTDHGDDI